MMVGHVGGVAPNFLLLNIQGLDYYYFILIWIKIESMKKIKNYKIKKEH